MKKLFWIILGFATLFFYFFPKRIVALEVIAIVLMAVGIAFMFHGIATLICNLLDTLRRKKRW